MSLFRANHKKGNFLQPTRWRVRAKYVLQGAPPTSTSAELVCREKVNEYCLHCLVLVVYFTSSKLNFRYTAFALCVLTHISWRFSLLGEMLIFESYFELKLFSNAKVFTLEMNLNLDWNLKTESRPKQSLHFFASSSEMPTSLVELFQCRLGGGGGGT